MARKTANQVTLRPTRKVEAGGLTSALTYVLTAFGLDLDAELVGALVLIGGFIAAYFRKEYV